RGRPDVALGTKNLVLDALLEDRDGSQEGLERSRVLQSGRCAVHGNARHLKPELLDERRNRGDHEMRTVPELQRTLPRRRIERLRGSELLQGLLDERKRRRDLLGSDGEFPVLLLLGHCDLPPLSQRASFELSRREWRERRTGGS